MKLLLAFFALAAIASAAVFHIPMTKVESNRARLTRLGKWKHYAIAKDLLRNKASGHQDLIDYDDTEYVANISVGTPATQQFRVLMATNSGDSWVTDKGCTSCTQHSLYDSSKSSTFVPDGREFDLRYGGMGYVTGVFAKDTMTLGGKFGLTVPKQTFGQATKLDQFPIEIDGIVGLGFTSISILGEPPVINAINQGLLDQPIFTVWLNRAGNTVDSHGGQITYGAFDADHCSTNIVYQPLAAATSWQFRMKSVSVGSYSSSIGWMAETSMFDSYLSGPKAVMDRIANVLGATEEEGGLYTLDCEHLPKDPIELVIGSNKINIQPENYISSIGEPEMGFCMLVLAGFENGGFGSQWYLGAPFSRQQCVVYDVEGQRIGFAPSIKIN